jgi:hypothetical protein
VPEPRAVSFRSQQDFREQLISALLAKGRDSEICPKRRISQISQGANQVPLGSHELVKMAKRGYCVACKGLRYGDWPRKRGVKLHFVRRGSAARYHSNNTDY